MNDIELCKEATHEEMFTGFIVLGFNVMFLIFFLIFFIDMVELLFAFMGIQFLCFASFKLKKVSELAKWVPVPIKLLHTEILVKQINNEYGQSQCFQPHIKYQYDVEGHTFSSERISVDIKSITTLTEDDSKKILALIEKGQSAFYNPRNPKESIVFNNIAKIRKSHYFALMTIGLILIMVTLWLKSF